MHYLDIFDIMFTDGEVAVDGVLLLLVLGLG